ncbi:MAG: inositol monophosphatase [Planctomycetaceae bacterium]|nr:inositol monophosphatase [Planctomycetaceae bacterium]
MQNEIIDALAEKVPAVMRWAGSIARELRQHNIAVTGKTSGSVFTDALTLADLTVQDLLVNAMRDLDPLFLKCKIEAEETTGDLNRFAESADLTISLDPIDGTKQFRDQTGNGYSVMLHLRNATDVLYSLIYLPEQGPSGGWVEVREGLIRCGADNYACDAREALNSLEPVSPEARPDSPNIYLIGFQDRDPICAEMVTKIGLKGFAPDDMPDSIYPLLGSGEFGGSLIHSPNIYDFPVSLHIARQLGGDAIWVHNSEPVHFKETWMDDRADMLRLPGIVACSANRETLKKLAQLAKNWNTNRYDT